MTSDGQRDLTGKKIDDICNVVKKPGLKNTNGMSDRGQQISVIAQENLKLAAFLFHHGWKCSHSWKITEVHENTIYLLANEKDDYKDPKALYKVKKADIAGTMEAIRDYLRSHYCVIRPPLAYIIKKTILI